MYFDAPLVRSGSGRVRRIYRGSTVTGWNEREPPTGSDVPFLSEADVVPGRVQDLSPLIRRVVAGNSGPYTYHGTCSYLVGRGDVAVIDPGPADEDHTRALLGALGPGERITAALVTHTHSDHAPGCRALKDRTGATVAGMPAPDPTEDPDPTRVVFGDPDVDRIAAATARSTDRHNDLDADLVVEDGEVIAGSAWTMEAVHTPGHASNHVCYHLREEGALFTGDHVMGWSTSVISPPDGDLGSYLASLRRLLERPQDERYLPGHGPAIPSPQRFVDSLLAHRQRRSGQILDVLASGPTTIAEIVPRLYAGTSKQLWPAAASSVYAHVLYLGATGVVETDDATPLRRASRIRLR